MNGSLRVTLLAGVEPTARAVRAHAMKNCVDVMMAISDMGSRGETGPHGERWTRLRDDLFRLRALLAEELRDELTVAPIPPAHARPCCVATLVDSVVARLADRAVDADVNVFVDHGGGVIFADEWPIAEALFNVLANAIQATAGGWIHTSAGVGGFWDVNGYRRIVSLSAIAMFSDPLGERPVPFTELVTIGGDLPVSGAFPAPMPGFFPGRLVDRSSAVATLRYKWPVGPWISGSLQGAVGNVFGEHLDGFEAKLLRFSGAVGIESDSSPDASFELLFGFGTETFDHGGQVDSLRLAVGVTRF